MAADLHSRAARALRDTGTARERAIMAEPTNPPQHPRRFYKEVSVVAADGVFALRLDGRTPRAPGGRLLAAPTPALADLIAEEWRRQGASVELATMPATRLAYAALHGGAETRALRAASVVNFGASDLLCYFAEGPTSLVGRQERIWAPLLEWALEAHQLAFTRAVGIVHRAQPPLTLARLAALVGRLDDFALVGLAAAASLFGSAILALALSEGRINADEAMAAARLDEIFQEERWGMDAEAAARADSMAIEAVLLERWFAALRPAA